MVTGGKAATVFPTAPTWLQVLIFLGVGAVTGFVALFILSYVVLSANDE